VSSTRRIAQAANIDEIAASLIANANIESSLIMPVLCPKSNLHIIAWS
jgi:hypothetical protein